MKAIRESYSKAEKEAERVAAASRMEICRESKATEEKEIENVAAVSRMKDTREQRKTHRENERNKCGRPERLMKFRHAVKYGAIFVSSSCHQRLFENGVTLITHKFKEYVESKKQGLYEDSNKR